MFTLSLAGKHKLFKTIRLRILKPRQKSNRVLNENDARRTVLQCAVEVWRQIAFHISNGVTTSERNYRTKLWWSLVATGNRYRGPHTFERQLDVIHLTRGYLAKSPTFIADLT